MTRHPYLDDDRPADAAFIRSLRDSIEGIIADVLLPDLRDAGAAWCYIVLSSETSVGWPDAAWGAAALGMADTLRESIGVRWRGPGPAVLVNDASIAEFRPTAGDFAVAFVATACHEAAHVVDLQWAAPPPAGTPAVPVASIAEALAAQVRFDPAAVAPWGAHGPSFLRLAEHLRHRVEQAWRFRVPPSLLWNSSVLSLSRPEAYAAALGDEPELMALSPLGDVARSPPPNALTQLFADDVVRHLRLIGLLSPVLESVPMFEKLLSKLRDRQARDESKAASAFMALAASIVDGKPPAEERIEATLAAAGKSVDDLEKACAALTRRRELAAKVAAGQQAEARRDDIQKNIARISREREAAEARFDAEEIPLALALDRAKAEITAAADAARELARSAGDLMPESVADLRRVADESRRAHEREVAERKREIEGAEHKLDALTARRADAARNGWKTDDLDADIAKQVERVDGLRDALRSFQETGVARLETADRELSARLLDVVLV